MTANDATTRRNFFISPLCRTRPSGRSQLQKPKDIVPLVFGESYRSATDFQALTQDKDGAQLAGRRPYGRPCPRFAPLLFKLENVAESPEQESGQNHRSRQSQH